MYDVLIIGCGITGASPSGPRPAGDPLFDICAGGVNPPGIKVLLRKTLVCA